MSTPHTPFQPRRIARAQRVTAHKRRSLRLEHAPFVLLYAYALRWALSTSGDPYRAALRHHELARDAVPERSRIAAAAARHAAETDTMDEWNMPEYDGPAFGVAGGDDDDDDGLEDAALVAEGELAEGEEGEYDLETLMRASEVPLPNPLMPSFWSVLFAMVVAIAHALLFFAQRWSVRFRALVQFSEVRALEAGCHAHVEPHLHQGKPELVPLQRALVDGEETLFFVFHRQKFLVVEGGTVVTEVVCPTDGRLEEYHASKGLSTARQAEVALERYGDNSLNIPTPSFVELYKEQIMGPVPVFQIFCASLWLLDEYPKYALFNMFSILSFEASTVFGRQKNLSTLRGMSNKSDTVRVYREGSWVELSTDALLPGDVFELSCGGGDPAGGSAADGTGAKKPAAEPTIPCDALIISGSAVVNEASLTGESTPLVKDAAPSEGAAAKEALSVDGAHKAHVLFSGTTLMQARATSGAASRGGVRAPNGGCLCVALRTGFLSSQGRLIRMIEYSSEKVQSDTKETLALLALLLLFALVAAANVMREGLKAGKRSQYELVLRCVLIVTRVVPPELPLQTAMAVNTALMTLMKAQIFCTEPFRIPYGGRVDACLFDKTGTITTDHLVLAGVSPVKGGKVGVLEKDVAASCSLEAGVVLGGCHALAEVAGKTVGDPIETSALKGIGWRFDASASVASPRAESSLTPVATKGARVTILHRYPFSSKLQRMSVVAKVKKSGGAEQTWVLTKGSPEAVQKLLAAGSVPQGYVGAYGNLAIEGMRVLGLAYRVLDDASAASAAAAAAGKGPALAREDVETDLSCAGLVAFECPVRRDSNAVIGNLRNGAHSVIMATGDNALTGLHVARATSITGTDASKALILATRGEDKLEWVSAASTVASHEDGEGAASSSGSSNIVPIPYDATAMARLAADGYDLCMTGESFRAAVAHDERTLAAVQHVRVYARMAPEDKEAVLRAMKERGLHTLMCGDGANDVGALKQAHVGVALLSGFAGVNTLKAGEKPPEQMTPEERKARAMELQAKARDRAIKMRIESDKDKKDMAELQKTWYAEELQKEEAKGNQWAAWTAMKSSLARLQTEQKRRVAARRAKYGGGGAGGLASQAAMLSEDAEGEVPMVKLGDASVAAPFTSKLPSITSTVDIIRQGRCTLVSTVQMQQVLFLNWCVHARARAMTRVERAWGDRRVPARARADTSVPARAARTCAHACAPEASSPRIRFPRSTSTACAPRRRR